jgi:hypothetical protein
MRPLRRLQTAVRDVRSAHPSELPFRLLRAAEGATGTLRRRFPPGALGDDELRRALHPHAPSAEAWRTHLQRRPPVFFINPASRSKFAPLLESAPPDARLQAVLDGATCLFGRPEQIAWPIDWHRDPASGVRWPRAHWSTMSVSGLAGDVRRVWELNRHTDLYLLGRGYWRTGDERYAAAAADRLRSWLADNPAEIGINWWSNLEIAMRATAWCWGVHFFADAAAFDAALLWDLTRGLLSSARHVWRDLAFTERCMPGNHVVGDAAGLATIAFAFPEFSEAAGWQRRALRVLEAAASEQFHRDGTHVELSPGYHVFVWELLFGVVMLGRRHGVALPQIEAALRRASRHAVLTALPDGTPPPLADADDAVGWDLGNRRGRAGVLAALAATALGIDELREAATGDAEELIWFGLTPLGTPGRTCALPTASSTATGCVARTGWSRGDDYWIMRGGGLVRHGHADALNLLLMVNGAPCLIDAGTYTYSEHGGWRDVFRGTAAHNTIRVDGRDHAQPHRAFRWQTSFDAAAEIVIDTADAVLMTGSHDAYRQLGISHRRHVLWRRSHGWVVVDHLEGVGHHLVELRWHLPASALPTSSGARLRCGDEWVEVAVDVEGMTSLLQDAAWTSPRYGERVASTVCLAAGRRRLPCAIVTVITRVTPGAGELRVASRLGDGADALIDVQGGGCDGSIAVGPHGWRNLAP